MVLSAKNPPEGEPRPRVVAENRGQGTTTAAPTPGRAGTRRARPGPTTRGDSRGAGPVGTGRPLSTCTSQTGKGLRFRAAVTIKKAPGKQLMVACKDRLNGAELAELVQYLRSLQKR